MEDDIQNLDSFNFNIVVNKKSKTTSYKDNMSQRATKQKKKASKQTPKLSTIIEENTEQVHEGNAAIMIEKNTENNKIEITPDNAANAETPLLRRKRKLYSPKDVKIIEEVHLKSQENDFLDSKVNKIPTSVPSYKPYKDLQREPKKYFRMPQNTYKDLERKRRKYIRMQQNSYKDLERERKTDIRMPKNCKSKLLLSLSPRSKKDNDLFDEIKEYYEQLKLANKGNEVYNSSSDSEDFKPKIEISKRKHHQRKQYHRSTTTSGAEEGTMVLSRGRVVKPVNYINNSNITIRRRTKKKLADIKPANELIDERIRKQNEVLNTAFVVDVPQMVEGEPELVLEKKLQIEPITEKAEKSKVNSESDFNSPVSNKTKRNGDIESSKATAAKHSDSENDPYISKVVQTPLRVMNEKSPILQFNTKRNTVLTEVNVSRVLVNRTKSKDKAIENTSRVLRPVKKQNELLNTAFVVDVPQMVEREPELVLEKKLQMKPITKKAEKSKVNSESDFNSPVKKQNELLNTAFMVDVPQMVEGEPELVLEKKLQMKPITKKAEKSKVNSESDFNSPVSNKTKRNGDIKSSKATATKHSDSENDPYISKTVQTPLRVINEKSPILQFNTKRNTVLTEDNVSRVLVNRTKSKDKAIENTSRVLRPRPVKSNKFKSNISRIKLLDNDDKLTYTSLSDEENYINNIRKPISKTRTEVLSNQSSIEKEESVKKVIPKKKMILDLIKNNEQENFAHSSEPESVQDKISTSTKILDSRNLKRMIDKRKKVLGDFNSGSGITVSSVDDWFKRNEPSSSRAGASINLLKESIQNVIEKLESTLAEINQKTNSKLTNLFMKADHKLRDMELECENMYKREVSNLISEMIRTIDEKMIELNKRSLQQHVMFKKFLKEEFSGIITEDCKKKQIMMQSLKEYIQSIIEHAGNSTE